MYKLMEGIIIIEGMEVKSYSISFNENICFKDVSTEKTKVERLINLFNEDNINPTFAEIIIEDFLS